MLIRYIKENNRRVGILVAECIDDTIKIGWSKCNKKDHFNKELGLKIARGRMNSLVEPPKSIGDDILDMAHRASLYYKQARVVEYTLPENWS